MSGSKYKCNGCDKQFVNKQCIDYHNTRAVCKNKISDHLCKFCGHRFTTKTSLYRHIRISCKVKKRNEKEKNEIYERLLKLEEENGKLKEEMMQMKKEIKYTKKKTIINTNNGMINNGTINNITLVAYGNEDISKLDKSDILKALRSGYHSTIKLTETIHFNPKHPEYHNVYITNMKDRYAMIYDGINWTLTIKNNLINKIYDDKKNYIEDNLEEFVDSLSVSQKNALERWLDVDDCDDKIHDIKERIKLLLYNSKHIPIETTENIELNILKDNMAKKKIKP